MLIQIIESMEYHNGIEKKKRRKNKDVFHSIIEI